MMMYIIMEWIFTSIHIPTTYIPTTFSQHIGVAQYVFILVGVVWDWRDSMMINVIVTYLGNLQNYIY